MFKFKLDMIAFFSNCIECQYKVGSGREFCHRSNWIGFISNQAGAELGQSQPEQGFGENDLSLSG